MDNSTGFGFFTGTYDVVNRRRKDFLDPTEGADRWEEFPGLTRASAHFDGRANFDEIEFPTKGFAGLTLRLYDPAADAWSLYWASKRTGTLFPPVTGRFEPDGTGVFHGDDEHLGRGVKVRFVWSEVTETTAHWEQAFSVDEGRTWITNWHMHMTRRAT
ncbi:MULTISPECIES: hypothetical protein [Streptomyces violaceusniger group]|uniref:DUF1579 domain-containing protein n=2 Tax=Streptomyces violaceusniger group TaxID=2839105 RepID=A0ABD5JMS8_9ACTN|nr:hypothetical protein [Streptomyces violaceusniger]KUL44210.1 hypothetical protein ADL28_40580 [Streptomyces violaceusniger]MEE4588404.1 hypothetical protein [Streptomyces sp. DSM 41602]